MVQMLNTNQTENDMTKSAKDIKVGDIVKTKMSFYINVQEVGDRFQKNGKRIIVLKGSRIWKSERERLGVIETWGDYAERQRTIEFKENTKVTFK